MGILILTEEPNAKVIIAIVMSRKSYHQKKRMI